MLRCALGAVGLLALMLMLSPLPLSVPEATAQRSSSAKGGRALLAVPDDTVALAGLGADGDDARTSAQVALSLSQSLPDGSASEVVIARDDAFADALTSGVLQAAAPLLLVPPQGPVPDAVLHEIARLGATRATILGGGAAVSGEAEGQLAGTGLSTTRHAGPDRIATAVAVADAVAAAAGEAAHPETAILVRAFGAPGGDPTQAFADSLGAGALAARTGWPVLLTGFDALSAATASHLATSGVRRVIVVGGPSALSPQVDADLAALGLTTERVAGADRFQTAARLIASPDPAVASAADVSHVLVVDGVGATAWAGGLASARRAALLDAPALLAGPDRLPEPTRAFLAGPAAGGGPVIDPTGGPVLTCVQLRSACEQARIAMRLAPSATITAQPAPPAELRGGQVLQVTVAGVPDGQAKISGDCTAPGTVAYAAGASFPLTAAADPVPSPCSLTVAVAITPTTEQMTTLVYNDIASFTLAATGDILIHQDVTAHARQPDGTLNYGTLLTDVAPVISAADIGLCHLEVPLTTDPGAVSGYPTFNAPADLAGGIAVTGWDVCSTASNHTLDQGFAGVVSTLDILDRAGIAHVGSARSAEESGPVLRKVAGTTVAFLSATYGTNGIPRPADKPWSVNLIDPAFLNTQAAQVRDAGAEVVVLSLHWGEEYSHAPSAAQARVAEAIAAGGLVDLIVGHHAHVVQPVVWVGGLPVAFGLGNFLSGQFQSVDRSDGVILRATFREVTVDDWAVDIAWTPTRVDRGSYHVLLLDDPQTPADASSATRTNEHMTWDG